MAKYKVIFDNSQAAVFGSLAGNTDSFDSRLRAIANAMDTRDGSMAALRNQIRTTAGKLPPIAMRLRREGDAWRQSVEIYRAAEQSAKSFVGTPVKICVEAERPKNIVELIVWWITRILEDIKKRSLGSGAVQVKTEPKTTWAGTGIVGAVAGAVTGAATEIVQGIVERAEMQRKLDEFTKYVLDKTNWTDKAGGAAGGIDVDNAYGEQCADISKLWYMKLFGVSSVRLSAWNDAGTAPMVNFPAKNTMTDVSGGPYAAGDIGFTIKPPSTGHTYVIISNPDANGNVQILEQNYRSKGNSNGSPQIRTISVSEITNGYRK